jgi:hypothetical protein
VITGGHLMPVRYIFHTAGPEWSGGGEGEPGLLAACYRNCLARAEALGLQSLAFCSISTGIFGYPLARAAGLALAVVRDELLDRPETSLRRVVFAMFQEEEYHAYRSALRHMAPALRRKHWLKQMHALERYGAEHPSLHDWVTRQQQRQREGMLEPARERVLRQLDFPFLAAPSDLVWEERFAQLQEFVGRWGTSRLGELVQVEPELAGWLEEERRRWNKGRLSAEQGRRLGALGLL